MKKSLWAVALLVGTVQADLLVKDGYVRASIPGASNTAAFMTLVNPTDQPIVITQARSSWAEATELHTHSQDNGVMRMREVPAIEVPGGGQIELKPGGLHVMFMNLSEAVEVGQREAFELVDANGAVYPVDLPVESIKARGTKGHNHHD